jgi:hypothetical protein
MANQRTAGFIAKPRNPEYTVGKKHRTVQATAALVSASMTNGDTLELAGPLTFDARIARVFTPNASPALTAAADVKLGFFYKDTNGNLVLIKAGSDAVLWNGVTLASALSTRDLLLGLNSSLDTTKNIGDLLAMTTDQEPAGGVYLVMTFPTKPSVNGTLDLDIVIEEATTE